MPGLLELRLREVSIRSTDTPGAFMVSVSLGYPDEPENCYCFTELLKNTRGASWYGPQSEPVIFEV